jgi:hypothetical protein
MTTVDSDNVHVLAFQGGGDDMDAPIKVAPCAELVVPSDYRITIRVCDISTLAGDINRRGLPASPPRLISQFHQHCTCPGPGLLRTPSDLLPYEPHAPMPRVANLPRLEHIAIGACAPCPIGACTPCMLTGFVLAMLQTVHYFFCYFRAIEAAGEEVGHPVTFAVPCGALGNITAALLAKRLGLPIARLIGGTNVNDIFHRAVSHGDFSRHPEMARTLTEAINIQACLPRPRA